LFVNAQRLQGYWLDENTATEGARLASILRDLMGNPFGAVTIDPSWLIGNDGATRQIAQAIYDGRAFDRLPVLADALEEAGCQEEDILTHCRQAGEHARGCWLIDKLLGQE
jgi:hypothetical protein